jgi:hypothetical protein
MTGTESWMFCVRKREEGKTKVRGRKQRRLMGVKEESGHLLAMEASAFDSICR